MPDTRSNAPILRRSLFTTMALLVQLALGAILRHTGTGLWAHLIGAAFVTGGIVSLFFADPKNRLVHRMGLLLLIQLILGGITYFSGNTVPSATAHVAVGALLLAASVLLSVQQFCNPSLKQRVTTGGLSIYVELTKPRLTLLAVVTSLLGFWLASPIQLDFWKLLLLLLGTELVGSGANALNQYLEKEADAKMRRTSGRPLPSRRMNPESALGFGVWISVAGLWILTLGINPLAGSLAALTLATYLFLYTPLKRRTPLCTLIGAIPGAIPPLIGWAAAKGSLGLEAWWLFAILFLWQLPHFLAIAWECREEYAKAGFKMLPILDPDGRMTGRQIVLYCLALVPVSLLPTPLGFTGTFYFLGALVSSLAFLSCGLWTAWARSTQSARRLFLASVCYLPWLMVTLTLDRLL